MYGAIIGDLEGSIYEYDQISGIKPVFTDKLIVEQSFFSDDTILTIAILDAILHDQDYEKYLKKYIINYANYKPKFTPYFKTSFSPGTMKWAKQYNVGTSKGNGAIMRISPVGYLFDNEQEIIKQATLATMPSHNSKEAIQAAILVSLMIYYFRKGFSKEEVYQRLNIPIEYHPFQTFNTSCTETLGNCFYSLYTTNSFEEAIRKILSMGGDTDTNSAIVGSVAEAMYGIDDSLKLQAEAKLPNEFVKVLKKAVK